MPSEMSERDYRDLIDTLIAEAGGEPTESQIATAYAIANRAAKKGISPGAVVRQKSQFEGYTNPGPAARRAQQDPAVRARMEAVWNDVASGAVDDPLNGGTMFHASSIKPYWADDENRHGTVQIGGHTYYKGGSKLPPGNVPRVATLTDTTQPPEPASPDDRVTARNTAAVRNQDALQSALEAYAAKKRAAIPPQPASVASRDIARKAGSQSELQAALDAYAARKAAEMQKPGLTTRQVQTVPIDPQTGMPVSGQQLAQVAADREAARLRSLMAPSVPISDRVRANPLSQTPRAPQVAPIPAPASQRPQPVKLADPGLNGNPNLQFGTPGMTPNIPAQVPPTSQPSWVKPGFAEMTPSPVAPAPAVRTQQAAPRPAQTSAPGAGLTQAQLQAIRATQAAPQRPTVSASDMVRGKSQDRLAPTPQPSTRLPMPPVQSDPRFVTRDVVLGNDRTATGQTPVSPAPVNVPLPRPRPVAPTQPQFVTQTVRVPNPAYKPPVTSAPGAGATEAQMRAIRDVSGLGLDPPKLAPAVPQFIEQTVQVANPLYRKPPQVTVSGANPVIQGIAPQQPQRIESTNGYIYEPNPGGGYTKVGTTRPQGMKASLQYDLANETAKQNAVAKSKSPQANTARARLASQWGFE